MTEKEQNARDIIYGLLIGFTVIAAFGFFAIAATL